MTLVTGESCVSIKVRNCNLMASCGFAHLSGDRVDQVQTGKCPVCGCGKLCKEYSRPTSKFSVFEDSALVCESKLLLAWQAREYIHVCITFIAVSLVF